MYFHDKLLYIEDEDQCGECEHYLKGIACPLLDALIHRVIYLDGQMNVTDCGFFKEFERKLKLI